MNLTKFQSLSEIPPTNNARLALVSSRGSDNKPKYTYIFSVLTLLLFLYSIFFQDSILFSILTFLAFLMCLGTLILFKTFKSNSGFLGFETISADVYSPIQPHKNVPDPSDVIDLNTIYSDHIDTK